MSVLVAIKEKDRVVVGVDTRISAKGGTYIDSYNLTPKAIHLDDKKTIIAGSVGTDGLVGFFAGIMKDYIKDADRIDKDFLVEKVLPKLVATVDKYHLDKDGSMDGEIFLAIKNKGYVINSNYWIHEMEHYYTMGSGDETSMVSLYSTSGFKISTEERIAKAVKAAASVNNGISKNCYIGDTAGTPFTDYK